ncbi:MAG TPA: di-heme enzyme [Polyangiaceae bacterium]|nr:di-heme enzyme [Polyangiaceae bacterium]
MARGQGEVAGRRPVRSWLLWPLCGSVAVVLSACNDGSDGHAGTVLPDAGRIARDAGDSRDSGSASRDSGAPRADASSGSDAGAFPWPIPPSLPVPVVPPDNPLTVAKVELGRHLFYDTRLSLNQTQACATCHRQELAFTDGRAQGLGSTGQLHPRGPMSLANVAYAATLTWANPVVRELERQATVPMFGEAPVELGLSGHEDELLARLRAEPAYGPLFSDAFPEDADPVSILNVTRGLASFERVLLSGNSRYDRFEAGDESALTASEQRGLVLFNSEKTECNHCHGGFDFTDSVTYEGKAFDETPFHNNGLYNLGGTGAYPADNTGLAVFTGKKTDTGRFKAPTLRNIAVTAPYMHDGSIATLDGVLDHYAAGGRTIDSGPNAGDGAKSPYKDPLITGFTLSAEERVDFLAFLGALTDEEFLTDPRFSNPWK